MTITQTPVDNGINLQALLDARPDYSWLDLPILDRKGYIRHDGGIVTDVPRLYLLGTPFLRRRRSSFINGADADSEDLADHLHETLGR